MQTSRAMRAPGLSAADMTNAVALQDWMFPTVSQPHTRIVKVPVLLRAGGPLSTTRIGNRYTFCSCRLKPERWVLIPAVLSADTMREEIMGGMFITAKKPELLVLFTEMVKLELLYTG